MFHGKTNGLSKYLDLPTHLLRGAGRQIKRLWWGLQPYAKQFHLLDIAASCSEETWELPFYLCIQSTLRKAGQWKCSFQTPQKFRSIAVKGWKEVLKASTLVETRSVHQSLFMRRESLPICNDCSFPVFSSLAVILTSSLSLGFMLISSFHSRRWKIMLLFNL